MQREMHQLYRRVLRAAKLKDGGSGSTTELVKTEFREQARKEVEHCWLPLLPFVPLHTLYLVDDRPT